MLRKVVCDSHCQNTLTLEESDAWSCSENSLQPVNTNWEVQNHYKMLVLVKRKNSPAETPRCLQHSCYGTSTRWHAMRCHKRNTHAFSWLSVADGTEHRNQHYSSWHLAQSQISSPGYWRPALQPKQRLHCFHHEVVCSFPRRSQTNQHARTPGPLSCHIHFGSLATSGTSIAHTLFSYNASVRRELAHQ